MSWTDDIVSANALTRVELRDHIERAIAEGYEGHQIAESLDKLGIFDESRVDLGKADFEPPEIHVHVHNNMEAAQITVEPSPIYIEPPVIHVEPARVEPTPIHVDAPVVNIAQAAAKAEVPIVIPAPVVNLTPELRIVSMPERVTSRKVERDKQGLITRTLDVESDA